MSKATISIEIPQQLMTHLTPDQLAKITQALQLANSAKGVSVAESSATFETTEGDIVVPADQAASKFAELQKTPPRPTEQEDIERLAEIRQELSQVIDEIRRLSEISPEDFDPEVHPMETERASARKTVLKTEAREILNRLDKK